MERKAAIREFLRKLLVRKNDCQPFSDDASLLLSGRLQSVDAIALAVFLEKSSEWTLPRSGFDQEKMDTVDAIASLVEESSHLHP